MLCEFEEKEFESLLYNQIERNCEMAWSPGQCFENYIGIDRASYIKNLDVWKKMGYSYRSGRTMIEEELDELWKHLGIKRELPDFKFNLFIQAKRPYCYKRLPNKISKCLNSITGFKFVIDHNQQLILEYISEKLSNDVLVVYAAPRFGTLNELYSNTISNKLIENTTFPEIRNLHGHKEWYYNNASYGVACSEPEKILDMSIVKRIHEFFNERLRLENEWNDFEKHNYNLRSLTKKIVYALMESPSEIIQSQLVSKFLTDVNTINNYSKYYDEDVVAEKISDFIIMNRFCEIFELNWFVLDYKDCEN